MSKPNLKIMLGARSKFSIGESTLSPKKIIELAAGHGYTTVAMTDMMSISGMIEFSKAAQKHNIKAIIGAQIAVCADATYRPPKASTGLEAMPNPVYYVKLFARTEQGMLKLFKLLSKGFSKECFYHHARVSLSDVVETLAGDDFILTTSDFKSVVAQEQYVDILNTLRSAHSASQTFLEISPVDTPLWDTVNARSINFATENDMQLLMTYPVCYQEPSEATVLQFMGAIKKNQKMADAWRPRQFVTSFDMKSPAKYVTEVVALRQRLHKWHSCDHNAVKKAVDNMQVFADQIHYKWEKKEISMPRMAPNEMREVTRLCKEGWMRRLHTETLGYKPEPSQMQVYRDRLLFELQTLKDMNFERYFLLVHDLVQWSKSQGILVGPGRGSVGGSLVAYLMGITDVDPIRFDLLFERFINPDRLDLPDADLDFMSARRHEVVEYLKERHGPENVGGITNFSTLGSASAMRDAGRVSGLSPIELAASKYVPAEHGKSVKLEEAVKEVPEIAKYAEAHPTLWEISLKLQGLMRGYSQHAGGVIVAGEPLENFAVIEDRGAGRMVNWDKRFVEDQGLVKMDLLGLSTLDTIALALDMIKEEKSIELDLNKLPLDDPKVLEGYANGDTVGVFQFSSGGMRKLLKDIGMGGEFSFEDIVACVALYRPGPMDAGLMDDYVQIRQDFKIPYYEHPNMENALKATQGVIIYQEQVMQLARDLAGFTMTDADHLRKAMGKKDKEMMADQAGKWCDGCVAHSGISRDQAQELFDKIEKFAGYAFNRSHSVEYSIISYWCMFMKTYFPLQFYAASLSVVGEDSLHAIVADAREKNILIMAPDINISGKYFKHGGSDGKNELLYAPFNRLKGLSDKTTAHIIAARDKMEGKLGRTSFESKAEFLSFVNKTSCNKRHQAVLEEVGSFASITEGSPKISDPSRLKSQMELMPGLIIDYLKADRAMPNEKRIKAEILTVVREFKACDRCDLKDKTHCIPQFGKAPKFMVVTDSPNWSEEQNGKMFAGKANEFVKEAMGSFDLDKDMAYFTSLVKAKKEGKMLTNEQIRSCSQYLDREVEILKPPIIVALGGSSIRHFCPDVKGGIMDLAGKVIYVPKLDASVICGINPLMVAFDDSKQDSLNDVFAKVSSMIL